MNLPKSGCFVTKSMIQTDGSDQGLYCRVLEFGRHALLSRGWGIRDKRRIKG